MFKSYKSKMLLYWVLLLSLTAISVQGALAMSLGILAGWVYSLAFAFSALPQCNKAIKDGHCKGVADGTIILWMLGELAGIVYGFSLMQLPIIVNCLINTLFVGIIVWYRLFPREKDIHAD